MKRAIAVGVGAALALAIAGRARGDVMPPNSADCATKSTGAICRTDDGNQGVCVTATCTRRVDDPDGGPPTMQDYDCLVCAATPPSPDGGDVDAAVPPPATNDGSGCATSARARGSRGAGAALALVGLALLGLRRRRGER